jgi:AraC family transcriptional regulator of adaptative response/methylated-DNA-[protein]-cysteine methyltransferase
VAGDSHLSASRGALVVTPWGPFRVEFGHHGLRRFVPHEAGTPVVELAHVDVQGTWSRDLARWLARGGPGPDVPLEFVGTPFQVSVWEALRTIPAGETRTYGAIAASLGSPRAARAVARACASNELAIVIPCHRVVPSAGGTGGYRWGESLKRTLLEHEAKFCKLSDRS